MLWCLIIEPRGEVYRVYKSGPKTEPWGTPKASVCGDEETFSIKTLWVRPHKYDSNHFKTIPLKPNVVLRRSRRMLWSIVSKAALRSSKTRTDILFQSAANNKSLRNFKGAVFVLWFFSLLWLVIFIKYCSYYGAH